MSVEQHIDYSLPQITGNIASGDTRSRIDNSHIHAEGGTTLEKFGMKRLAHRVVAAERERQVAHSPAHSRTGQILLYPPCCTDKVKTVARMFGYSCCHSKYIRIKYYIFSRYTGGGEQTVSTGTYLAFTLKSVSLTHLVESHNDHSCTHRMDMPRTSHELLLTLFQAYGIYYRLALHEFQSRLHHTPVG